ncbi:MAG: cupredoxin domain-containing protein [Solirubrobacteraceae bacterium]|nr:cupredoxin domain-containing protein [Solirubrobacteraceae bacterium]
MALHRRALLLIALAAVTLAATLGVLLTTGSGGGPASADAAATKTVRINIKDMAFSKTKITITVGTKVKWTNRDDMKHNATTSQKGGPKGKLLATGKSYTWTATRTGTFKYHCTPHPWMKGTIVVKKRAS